MRIVVTGASGQLGSYLIDRLSDGPHEVIAWSGRAPQMRGELTLQPVDLTDSRQGRGRPSKKRIPMS